MWIEEFHDAGMAKQKRPGSVVRPRKPTAEPQDAIFLREWLAALGLKQGKIAEAAGVNTGYVSQLVNREKYPDERPRVSTVRELAGAMEMPWYLLYELPPPDPVPMADLAKYPDDLIRRMAAARRRRPA